MYFVRNTCLNKGLRTFVIVCEYSLPSGTFNSKNDDHSSSLRFEVLTAANMRMAVM